jgi:hypothetical protein
LKLRPRSEAWRTNPDYFGKGGIIAAALDVCSPLIIKSHAHQKIDQPVAYITWRNRTSQYCPGAIAPSNNIFWISAMINTVVRLLLIAVLLAPISALAAADQARTQFCWAIGKFDHTVYFAEAETREDRQAGFDDLLEISGIDHHAVKCDTLDSTSYRLTRTALLKDWLESEFEIVNTTFLSDLDY